MQSSLILESIIAANLRPSFLAITQEEDYINVVISHPSFVRMEMSERVITVFDLIKLYSPDILKENVIVVQPFCADEMEDLLEHWVYNDT